MKVRTSNTNELVTRSLRLRVNAEGRPETIDKENRTIEITVATETDTVRVWDWELGLVPEILLMSGCRAVTQVPLLDTHSRESVSKVLGSVRKFRIDGADQLGIARYSKVKEADDAFTKTDEGHLTDYSAGYRPLATTSVADGETVVISGRSFTGPCLVITEWELKEVSTCPIGADNRAKARALDSTNQEDIEMKEFLRKMRVKLALAEDATEDQVRAAIEKAAEDAEAVKVTARGQAAPVPPPVAAPPAAGSDDAARAAAEDRIRAEERARTVEITALCEAHGCRELSAEMLKSGTTVAESQRKVLEQLKTRAGNSPTPGFRIERGADERDKFRSAAQDALLLNGGVLIKGREIAPGATDLRGYSLREMARECLVRAGNSASGDIRDVVGRALTTSDLPNVLANVANMSMLVGFESVAETYETWCDTTGSLSDFKPSDLVRLGEVSDLQEVKEGGEIKYGKTADTKETAKLATYAEIIPITRQAIINDNLGVLTELPRSMGEACGRLQGDLAYGVLIANANMADGKALFHADHGNLAGTGSVISLASLNEGELAMGLQKDLLGKRRLNIPVVFLIAPMSLKGSAEQFFGTQLIGGESDQPNLVNPFFGPKVTRVYDGRLDDDSVKAWYLAGPKGKTVKLFYLNGNRNPFMDQKTGWTVDGIELKVRMDAAAKSLGWQPLYKNTGPSS